MCLCALIYNERQGISSPQDLIQIMNIGNELYSNLSRLARQSFLMFTELPSHLSVFDTDYHLSYSESYSGRVLGECHIEGYQYCVPFRQAFELLLTESYTEFILTIDSAAVCIYLTDEGKFKIFDSHSRDKFGKSHPLGTCVLLEAKTVNNVIEHFQTSCNENSQFELKAIVIKELGKVSATSSSEINITDNIGITDLVLGSSKESKIADISCSRCKQCSAISFYSICYSNLKPSNYWDSKTVAAVVNFGNTLYDDAGIITSSDLPKEIEICGTKVHVKLQANYQGKLNAETERQWNIESLIHNDENTGFLIWLGGYCLSCIFQKTSKNKSYSILAYDERDTSSTAHFVKNIDDEQTLVNVFLNLARSKIKKQVVSYEIQYLSCSSPVADSERKNTLRRHRQNYNNLIMKRAKNRRHFKEANNCRITEDLKKKKILESKRRSYQALDQRSKEELLKKQRNRYKERKQKLLENKRANYHALEETSKQESLKKRRTHYKEQKQKILENKRAKHQALDETGKHELLKKMRDHYKQRKQKLLENKRSKYQALNKIDKQELLTKNMNYYKTMEKEQKQKMLESKKEKYKEMNQLSRNMLISTHSKNIMKKRMSLDENQKTLLLITEKEKRLEKRSLDIQTCITKFKKKIKAGPFYICCVCNRTLY